MKKSLMLLGIIFISHDFYGAAQVPLTQEQQKETEGFGRRIKNMIFKMRDKDEMYIAECCPPSTGPEEKVSEFKKNCAYFASSIGRTIMLKTPENSRNFNTLLLDDELTKHIAKGVAAIVTVLFNDIRLHKKKYSEKQVFAIFDSFAQSNIFLETSYHHHGRLRELNITYPSMGLTSGELDQFVESSEIDKPAQAAEPSEIESFKQTGAAFLLQVSRAHQACVNNIAELALTHEHHQKPRNELIKQEDAGRAHLEHRHNVGFDAYLKRFRKIRFALLKKRQEDDAQKIADKDCIIADQNNVLSELRRQLEQQQEENEVLCKQLLHASPEFYAPHEGSSQSCLGESFNLKEVSFDRLLEILEQ